MLGLPLHFRKHLVFDKQSVYMQQALQKKFLKQLKGLSHLAISNNIKLQIKGKYIF